MNFEIGKSYTCNELTWKNKSFLLGCNHFICLEEFMDTVIFKINYGETTQILSDGTILLKLNRHYCKYYNSDFNEIMDKEILLFRENSASSYDFLGKYKFLKKDGAEIFFCKVKDKYGVLENDYNSNSNETFGKFVIETDSTSINVILSMTTESILSQEIDLLNEISRTNNDISIDKHNDYHTYFFELVLDSKSKKKYLESNLNNEQNEGVFYQVLFLDETKSMNQFDENNIFSGQLFVANSPFKILNKKVIIKKLKFNSIQDKLQQHQNLRKEVFGYFSSSLRESIIQRAIDNFIGTKIENIDLEHFYLGQANSSKINFSETKGYYDIGFSLFYDKEGNQQKKKINFNKDFFSNEQNIDFFILSHIHFDHVAGICNFSKDALCKNRPLWLMQNFLEFKNVAKYLDSIVIFLILNKVNLFLVNYDDFVYKNFKLSIGRGQCGNGIDINQTSILFDLKSSNQSLLFTGDCSYRYISPQFLNTTYDYIQICHHGTKLNKKDELSLKSLIDDNSIGICSVGLNTYGHPDKNHLNWFNTTMNLADMNKNRSYSHTLY